MKITYHQDPGHGWIKVSRIAFAGTGAKLSDFSRFSYQDSENFYFEEDCDGPKILELLENQFGKLDIVVEYSNVDSPIRRKSSIRDLFFHPFFGTPTVPAVPEEEDSFENVFACD